MRYLMVTIVGIIIAGIGLIFYFLDKKDTNKNDEKITTRKYKTPMLICFIVGGSITAIGISIMSVVSQASKACRKSSYLYKTGEI